jgi:hypothetical protein
VPRFRLREEFRRRGGLYHLYVILSLCLSVLCNFEEKSIPYVYEKCRKFCRKFNCLSKKKKSEETFDERDGRKKSPRAKKKELHLSTHNTSFFDEEDDEKKKKKILIKRYKRRDDDAPTTLALLKLAL